MTRASKKFPRLWAGLGAVATATLIASAPGAFAQTSGSSGPTSSPSASGSIGGGSEMQSRQGGQMPEPSEQSSGKGSGKAKVSPAEVREIQQALNQAGHNPGPVDGVWGRQTANALQQFQQSKGIQASGQPDEQTKQALGVEQRGSQSESGSSGPSERPSQ